MKLRVITLQKMLEQLSRKTGYGLDPGGLKLISEEIGLINHDYLYKTLLQKIKKLKGEALVTCQDFHVNAMLRHLGFPSIQSFEYGLANPLTDQLLSLIGSYYSYVRVNHPQHGLVLRSPVRIYEHEGKLLLQLNGKEYGYTGQIHLRHGCLFILLETAEGKCFHHVYKLATRKAPIVLQGVFSGVSTAFDPIGGRALLIRQELSFDKLTNRKEKTEVLADSENIEDTRVAGYFKDYYNNNVIPAKSSAFGFDDLL
jgi:hypothetical protein